MKIAQVVSTFPPYKGGIGNTAYNFALQLQKLNQDVTTIVPLYQKETIFDKQLKVKALKPFFSRGNAASVPSLYNKLKGYDIIFFHYPFFGGVEPLILRKILHPKQKLVLFYHQDSMPPDDWLRSFVFNFYNEVWLPIVSLLADKIVVSSFDYAQNSNLKKYLAKLPEKFSEIPFGVNKDIFKPVYDLDKVKDLINFRQGEKIILYVGNISSTHYFKGIDYLLEAFLKLVANQQVKLCLVGRGDLVDNYRKQISDLGLSDKIFIFDQVDDHDLNLFYNLAKVTVLPSINMAEAFGLVLAESLAAGTPVIASDIPGVRQVFADGQSGFISKIKDSQDLAFKIKQIVNNPELQIKMSQAALAKSQKYDWQKSSQKLIDIFKELMRNK